MGQPGKFEACFDEDLARRLYAMSGNGMCAEEVGSAVECGVWFGLLVSTGIEDAEFAILQEDSDGFVDFTTFETEAEAREQFAELEDSFAEDEELEPEILEDE